MRSFCVALVLSFAITGAAWACTPPPPPPPPEAGESLEAYQTRMAALRAEESAAFLASRVEYQQQWWNESQSVLLARVERVGSVQLRDDWGEAYDDSPRVFLRPVRWLKGSGSARRFRLSYDGMTSCGPYGGGDAVDGEVGEVFVVYVREGQPHQRSVIESLAPENVVDPQVREMLGQLEVR